MGFAFWVGQLLLSDVMDCEGQNYRCIVPFVGLFEFGNRHRFFFGL